MAELLQSAQRRRFLGGGVMAGIAAGGILAQPQTQAGVSLREKFHGCIAACHIGSSMGAAVEGWPYERIEREHGAQSVHELEAHSPRALRRAPRRLPVAPREDEGLRGGDGDGLKGTAVRPCGA